MKTTVQILTAAVLITLGCFPGFSQNNSKPAKVSHAEPLFQDLVRDLGARKGEREFNLGAEFSNEKNYIKSGYLAEYEFAPINRLGLEAEADFSYFNSKNLNSKEPIPSNRLDAVKLSAQYTFFVSEKLQTSIAIGYTQAIELTNFDNYSTGKFITGLVSSPFLVIAKKWGANIHTMVYTYPMIAHDFGKDGTSTDWQINSSVMYSLPNSSNFIGIELNKVISQGKMSLALHPQIKIKIDSHFALGIVTGIPVSQNDSISSFFRLIIEP